MNKLKTLKEITIGNWDDDSVAMIPSWARNGLQQEAKKWIVELERIHKEFVSYSLTIDGKGDVVEEKLTKYKDGDYKYYKSKTNPVKFDDDLEYSYFAIPQVIEWIKTFFDLD